ncbi:MAG: single-stranded-DNA-specific exonuclease [Candidatus Azotimanducaceae bacterium]|jgi:single-stranded-DNA-specific exonuclease
MKNYRQAETYPESVSTELSHFNDLTKQLLFTRGIVTKEDAETFLNPSYDDHLHDPFLLHDMDKAVVRILRAIEEGQKITIFSDYDCDGIPGAVVLHDFFKAIGYKNFTNYIPHRHYEGFGFSVEAADKLHAEDVHLVITIDCGTTNHEAILQANRHGMDVIVTDHHEPKEKLPEAFAVVNPKVGNTYPFDGLCGSGVIYKLVQALIQKGTENKQFELTVGWEKWWLDMVGIATIADMVPLTGENRALARYGLDVLRKSRRPGLQHLLRKQKASQRHLTEDDIGFTIGPRINAASRMDTPEDAFHMLASTDEADAAARVDHLEKLNTERKTLVGMMTKELNKRMKDAVEIPNVLVLGNPEWRPSLVGLAANKLAEEHNRPVFLWGRDGNGVIKGSCRSNGVTSVVTLMESIPDAFIDHGGHHMSGGFAVTEENIHTLSASLNAAFQSLGEKAAIAEDILIDATLTFPEVNNELLKTLTSLAPFGMSNHKPLFSFVDVVPKSVQLFGKTKEHTKLMFDTPGYAKEAIAFFKLPSDFQKEPTEGEKVTVLAHVEQSFFMGRLQTRLRIVDII